MRRLRAHPVVVMIALGTIVRLVLAITTRGLPYDVESWELLRHFFSQDPLHVYSLVNPGATFHWPYPSGFLPLMLLVSGIADLTGGGFTHLVRGPAILADAALAWLVYSHLAGRVSERARLAAVAAVALGPVFIAISAYAVQIDAVAILPAVIALLVWERVQDRRRALLAGVLIGIAASIKTVPLVMVLALAPTSRSVRELLVLVAGAVTVPLLALSPFLLADPHGVLGLHHYASSPGMGGLSLVAQPDLAARWLTRWVLTTNLENSLFIVHAGAFNLLVVAAFGLYAWRWRPAPRPAAALLWLLVLAFGSGFFFQYLVWGLPFFLLTGAVRATILLQLLVSVPMLIYFLAPWKDAAIVYVYVPFMLAVWACWVAGAVALARGGMLRRKRSLTQSSALA